MKILWFSNTPASGAEYLKSGGLGGGWLSSLDKALSSDIELSVAFYYPKYIEPFVYHGVSYYPICKPDWRFQYLKNKVLNAFVDREDLNEYMKIVDEVQPDLIHIHGTENPFAIIIENVKVPVVVSIQGNITVYYHMFKRGIESGYLYIKKLNLKSVLDFPFFTSFRSSFKEFDKMRKREARNLLHCKNIIGRTDWDKRITRVLAPESKYFQGEEMLRASFYNNEWRQQKRDKLVIHTTNGNSPYKGFETLCHALSLLNELHIDVEWRVAGIKESDLIVKVVKRYLGKKYPDKGLVLMGGLNEEKLAENLLEADMYVMPSHIENSPNNLCEAMIIGMPCIASFAGGTGSMLKDGEEGILVQDGDPWALAGAILELKKDQKKAVAYGQKARQRALLRHNKEHIVSQLLNIYSTIINNGKKN